MEIFKLITALGVGGLLTAFFTHRWQTHQENQRKHQEYKETRYKCIIMLLHAALNFDSNRSTLNQFGYDIQNIEELHELLEAELINSYLFASNEFIAALQAFIANPSQDARILVAKQMRKDLWGLK